MAAAFRGVIAVLMLFGVAAACGSDESTTARSEDSETSVNAEEQDSVETGDDVEVEILGSSRASTNTTIDSDAEGDTELLDSPATAAARSAEGTISTRVIAGTEDSPAASAGPVATTLLTAEQQAELDAVIQVSTTSPARDAAQLEDTANEIIEAWWFNSQDRNFGELADELTQSNAVSAEFAEVWRQQAANLVEDQSNTTELVAVIPVRVEQDNATVQVAATNEAGTESVSFFEFELDEGDWTLVEVIS